MPRITKTAIERLRPNQGVLWDSELPGFHVIARESGRKSFYLRYRTRANRQRCPKIGDFGPMTLDKARKTARDWLGMVSDGGDPAGMKVSAKSAPTIKDLAQRYMEEHAPNKKERSQQEDARLWSSFIIPKFGVRTVAETGQSDIVSLHSQLKDRPTTANRVLALLSKAFNLAEYWGWRPQNSNPCRHVTRYKETKRRRYIMPDEAMRLGAVLDEYEKWGGQYQRTAALIKLLIFTGARLSEIMTAEWSWIDYGRCVLVLTDSKTGAKEIVLPPPAMEVLNRLKTHDETGSRFIIPGKDPTRPLSSPKKGWSSICRRAEIEGLRLHDLRHSFASAALASGASLPQVGELLGHASAETTKRYTHLMKLPAQRLAASAADEMQRLLIGQVEEK